MLGPDDLAEIAADYAEIVSDNPATVTIRKRDGSTVGPFAVRVSRRGSFTIDTTDNTERTTTRYVLLCPQTIPLEKGDRLNAHEFLFEVASVAPQIVGTQADVFMVE